MNRKNDMGVIIWYVLWLGVGLFIHGWSVLLAAHHWGVVAGVITFMFPGLAELFWTIYGFARFGLHIYPVTVVAVGVSWCVFAVVYAVYTGRE